MVVVDALEVVQVQHGDAQRLTQAAVPLGLFGQQVLHVAAVGQAGQLVGGGQGMHPGQGLGQFHTAAHQLAPYVRADQRHAGGRAQDQRHIDQLQQVGRQSARRFVISAEHEHGRAEHGHRAAGEHRELRAVEVELPEHDDQRQDAQDEAAHLLVGKSVDQHRQQGGVQALRHDHGWVLQPGRPARARQRIEHDRPHHHPRRGPHHAGAEQVQLDAPLQKHGIGQVDQLPQQHQRQGAAHVGRLSKQQFFARREARGHG